MQAKGLIKFFAIALFLVCLYQLTFTFMASRVEKNAENAAREAVLKGVSDPLSGFEGTSEEQAFYLDSINSEIKRYTRRYLDSVSSQVVYNLLITEYTYQTCKERQLSLGLDLQGGMSVVLQISLEELIHALSNKSQDPAFLQALDMAKKRQSGQENLVNLFGNAFKEVAPDQKLAAIFATPENKDRINFNSTNEEVLAFINQEASSAIERTYNIIRTRIDRFGVAQPNVSLQANSGRIIVELPGVDDPDRVRKLLQSTAQLEFWETWENTEVIDYLVQANNALRDIMKAKEGITPKDTTDSEVQQPSDDALSALQDSGEEAAADDDISKLLTGETDTTSADDQLSAEEFARDNPLYAVLTLAIYQDQSGAQRPSEGPIVGYALATDKSKVEEYLAYQKVRAVFPKSMKFIWSAKPITTDRPIYALYAIKTRPNDDQPSLSGDVIVDARQDFDQSGKPDVNMTMNGEGAKIWKRLTGENIGRSIAIVLDNQVFSAPVVKGEISGGQSQISGNFSINEAKDLANILKAGKLPAPARIVEEEVVGPSLGQESINAGLLSLLTGFLLVIVFMIVYYGNSGIVSNIALLLNLFFIIGVLASFGASLTLPGMAGIVLTIGMAVDANVIIFERIREERNRGKGMRLAIIDGYQNSYSAIVDANLTTLITGFILLFFGLGPVKGFATVLVIGIFSSLFTAVLVSRLIFDGLIDREKKVNFNSQLGERLFGNLNFPFLEKSKTAFMVSGVLLAISLGSILFRGFDLGVDFKGGRTYVVRFDKNVSTVDVASRLSSVLGGAPVVKTFGGNNQVKITTAYLIDDNSEEADSLAEAAIFAGLKGVYDREPSHSDFISNYRMSSMKVGPTIADDISKGAVWAAIFALLGIFLYILIRFRKWQWGLGALAALFHDVFIVLGLFSLFKGILPFSLEIDQAIVAALLTIIGYSINDTVVVFDRIREFLNLHPTTKMDQNINNAVNATLSRTTITSLTTLLVVLILFIFGGEVIRGFSFALLVGVIVGTYSSLFIATPVSYNLLLKEKAGK